MLIGGTNSATNLAMAGVAAEKKKPFISIGSATSDMTGAACTPYTVHYAYDTVALARGTGGAVVKDGGKTWFFLTADYAFGHALERDTSSVVKAAGGEIKGNVRAPLATSDFSSFLLQAQASKAQVIGLADGGSDVVNAIKQARSFGVGDKNQRLVALLVFLSDVHALGLDAAQGLIYTDGFYWDYDKDTREFSRRFEAQFKNNKPTMVQAGVYSSVYHFLKARAAAHTADWRVVAQKMREIPIHDVVMRNASIRPDGRVIHDMYLYQVKAPAESKGPWDYLKLLSTIPAQQAFRPMDPACPLVK